MALSWSDTGTITRPTCVIPGMSVSFRRVEAYDPRSFRNSSLRGASSARLVQGEDVALRVLEPGSLHAADLGDAVDGLVLGRVVLLENDALLLQGVDDRDHVVDLPARVGRGALARVGRGEDEQTRAA